ncbi:acid protease [Auriscalpium vulgare]|uniref:Acid protease n=1 Tax=Auriscalpium vulgare TaxID=40419 RepID=A0ACB8RYN2_9AGAM|nr:acid protease [Auriscalpium vulgare]
MALLRPRASSSRWKGKARAAPVLRRQEGQGGAAGIVLPLEMVGGGMYEAVYTVPVQVGKQGQNLSLQVDTGSSDLWIASTSCSSSACSGAKGNLYDPTSASPTNVPFSITYLAGQVSGPIYWDQVEIGGYSLNNQALAGATSVDSEPLESAFSGILGLALPLNSIIAEKIHPVDGNAPDGAAFASNLFGLTPTSTAPAARFLSLSLSRPGTDEIPALLGIGRHPAALVPDPSKIKYSQLISGSDGVLFWQVNVRGITVYIDGQTLPVTIGRSKNGAVFPQAVVDSGVPFILTTTAIANGIYGALGIGPAADGQYYVPCKTPLNMTVTLDGQDPLPLHPLDLTTQSQGDPSSSMCTGLIQTANGQMDAVDGDLDDMILGVPFMRNVYTVMAYDVPDPNGGFPIVPGLLGDQIHPRLGLLSLTDPTKALDEFNTVRVLNQPLSSGGGSSGQSSSDQSHTTSDGRKLSIGVEVLLGLIGFFALAVSLFALRWFLVKRRWRREQNRSGFEGGDQKTAYQLAQRGSNSLDRPSEDMLRANRFEAYKARKALGSGYTADTQRTHVNEDDLGEFGTRGLPKDGGHQEEEATYLNLDPWDASIGWRGTVVGDSEPVEIHPRAVSETDEPLSPPMPHHGHHPSPSEASTLDGAQGIAEPLLAHIHSRDDSRSAHELGLLPPGERGSMAGVGTLARGSRIGFESRHSAMGSVGSIRRSVSPGMRVPASPLSAQFPGMLAGEEDTAARAPMLEGADRDHS